MDSPFITVYEAAEYLRVSPLFMYQALNSRKIIGFKVGSSWRIKKSRIDEFINKQLECWDVDILNVWGSYNYCEEAVKMDLKMDLRVLPVVLPIKGDQTMSKANEDIRELLMHDDKLLKEFDSLTTLVKDLAEALKYYDTDGLSCDRAKQALAKVKQKGLL